MKAKVEVLSLRCPNCHNEPVHPVIIPPAVMYADDLRSHGVQCYRCGETLLLETVPYDEEVNR